MRANQTLRTTLCLAAFAGLASADSATDQEIRDALRMHAATVQTLRDGVGTLPAAGRTEASCTAVIDRARAAKLPATFLVGSGEEFGGYPGSYQTDTQLWALQMKDAHQVCSELGRWIRIATPR